MSWQQSPIVKPIPKELASIAGTAGGVASTLSAGLSAVSSLLSVAEVFFNSTTNPYESLTSGVLGELQGLNNNLFGTGVYALTVTGYDIGGPIQYDVTGIPKLTPGQAIGAAIASLDDAGDSARPQFTDSGDICAIGFLVSTPSVDQFIALAQQLLAIFDIPDFQILLERVISQSSPAPTQPPLPPDWKSIRLNSITQLKQIQDAVNDFMEHAKGYTTIADNVLDDLISVIDAKSSELQGLANTLDSLAADLAHSTGVYVLNLPIGTGGNNRLKQALADCPLQRSQNQYTAMALFVGGGPSLATVDAIRRLMV